MKRRFATVLVLGFASISVAQTNAPLRDYGGGFRKFYQLGLPDVTGGEYGKVELGCIGTVNDLYPERTEGLRSLGASGNAWKTRALGGGTNRFVVGGVASVDGVDRKVYEEWERRWEERRDGTDTSQRVESITWIGVGFWVWRWKAMDLKKDVATLLSRLENPGEKTKAMFGYDHSVGGDALIFAAHLYRLGMTNEGNRIAAGLFALHSDSKELLQQAVSAIADAQYRKAYAEFRRSGDWAAWHKCLVELLGKFTSGWKNAPGVRKLEGLVKTRVAAPEPPAPQGAGLTDEDRRLAKRLAVDPPAGDGPDRYVRWDCWILQRPQAVRPGAGAGTNDVMTDIRRRGMESVPVLIALLKDHTLVQPDRAVNTADRWAGRGSDEQGAESAFNSIDRPRTRGEIARCLLDPLLVLDDRQRSEVHNMTADDFAVECETWYKEYKGRTVQDVAKVYLEKGDNTQREEALGCLLQGKDADANRADVERILLGIARESRDTPNTVLSYVQRRREKASNFVEQVAVALLGTNITAMSIGLREGRPPSPRDLSTLPIVRNAEFVNQLRELVEVRSVKDLVAEYAVRTQSVAKVYAKLRECILQEDPQKSLDTLLDGVNKASNVNRRVALLELMPQLRYAHAAPGEDAASVETGGEAAPERANEFDPRKHDAVWRKLLEDKRGDRKSVREAAAWAIVELYPRASEDDDDDPPDDWDEDDTVPRRGNLSDVVEFFGDKGVVMLLDRAKATLNDKPVAPIPGSWKVDAAQREAMVRAVTAASDVPAALAELTPSHQLALEETGMTNRAVSAKLRPVADRITEVKVEGESKVVAGLEARLKGRSFGRETVSMLVEAGKQLAREGVAFEFEMTRRPNVGGMRVVLSCQNVGKEGVAGKTAGVTNGTANASVTGTVCGGTHWSTCRWAVDEKGGSDARSPGAADKGAGRIEARVMDEMEAEIRSVSERHRKIAQDGFWKELDLIVEKVGAYAPVNVTLWGSVPWPPREDDDGREEPAASGFISL